MRVYQKADRLIPSFRSLPPRSPRLRARQIGSIAAAEQLSAEGTGSLVQSPPPPLTAETGPVRREYPRQFGKKRSIKNPVARSCDFLPPHFFFLETVALFPYPNQDSSTGSRDLSAAFFLKKSFGNRVTRCTQRCRPRVMASFPLPASHAQDFYRSKDLSLCEPTPLQ